MHSKFWSGNLSGRDLLGNLGVEGKIVLEGVLETRISNGKLDYTDPRYSCGFSGFTDQVYTAVIF
jgi:hypothetical protein